VANLSELPDLLPEASLVLAATSSQEPLLSASDAPRIAKGALLLDLSLPPNIAPALKDAGDFQLFNLDDLKFHQRRELAELPQLLAVCAKTIEGHRELYAKIVAGLKGGDAFQPAGPDSN
jgi:glutamyl-tRNA reductase